MPEREQKPRTKKSPEWKSLPDAGKAEHLLTHRTISDRTWTDEPRLMSEKRDAFIRRILLGEVAETTETDEVVEETAKAVTAKAGLGDTVADRLRELGVRGVLVQMAERGQIIELRCEMPKCYCPKGRTHFDRKSHPPGPWDPSADHYPKLKMDGGRLDPWNVRLSHTLCNREDYGWRMRIRRMLEEKMSLEEIAEQLNHKGVRSPHGHGKWSAAAVRKAFVS